MYRNTLTDLGQQIPPAVRKLFLVFVFTLPFENTGVGLAVGDLSVAKIFGLLFIGCYFYHYNTIFQKRSPAPFPPALIWFAIYTGIYAFGFYSAEPDPKNEGIGSYHPQLIQLLVMFWISSDLLKSIELARQTMMVSVFAHTVQALGVLGLIPGFNTELAEGRSSGFDENPNTIAAFMAMGILIIAGTLLYSPPKRLRNKLILGAAALPLFMAMVATGSRGGILAFAAGVFVFLLPYRRVRRMAAAVVCVIILGIAGLYLIGRSPELIERWHETFVQGDTAGRDEIFGTTLTLILERPFLGWQGSGNAELGRRLNGHGIGGGAIRTICFWLYCSTWA